MRIVRCLCYFKIVCGYVLLWDGSFSLVYVLRFAFMGFFFSLVEFCLHVFWFLCLFSVFACVYITVNKVCSCIQPHSCFVTVSGRIRYKKLYIIHADLHKWSAFKHCACYSNSLIMYVKSVLSGSLEFKVVSSCFRRALT